MEQPNTVYIIDTYNKYCADKVIAVFSINGQQFAIKEVQLKWGVPQLSSIEEQSEPNSFYLYNTLEEARKFIRQIKRLNG